MAGPGRGESPRRPNTRCRSRLRPLPTPIGPPVAPISSRCRAKSALQGVDRSGQIDVPPPCRSCRGARLRAPWQRSTRRTAPRQSSWAARFTALTAKRLCEVRRATWDEIDLDARTWTIPGRRNAKIKDDHVVPLSGAALRLLHRALKLPQSHGVVFPNPVPTRSPVHRRQQPASRAA